MNSTPGLPKVWLYLTDDTFDVGEDRGTRVSPTYQPPFKFTGTLREVTVEVTDLAA